jgi:NADPH:quinone reductase
VTDTAVDVVVRQTTMFAYVGISGRPEPREVPVPRARSGEVLVEVEAFSINRGELGLFTRRADGWRPGQDIAGRVVASAAADGPAIGTRVVGVVDFGGWAQRVAVPVDRLAPLPDSLAADEVATYGVAGLTALRALRRGGPLLGARVLITGASGGVGTFAVQLAAAAGAEVTALTGSHRSVDLRELGAARVVNSLEDATGEFDLVLESVGGTVLGSALALTAPEGHIVMVGTSSNEELPMTLSSFRAHARQTLHPFWVYGSGESVAHDLGLLVQLTARGLLSPVVGWQGGWEHLADAMQALRDRKVAGKAVLRVDQEEATR